MRPINRVRRWFLGEFATPDKMLAAARSIRERGPSGELDTYSPFPLHDAQHALGLKRSVIPWFVFAGGMAGVSGAWLMEWWCNAVDYPINVGGRPAHSLPAFIPIMFELGVLLGAFGAFFGLWALLRLPRPHHPVF